MMTSIRKTILTASITLGLSIGPATMIAAQGPDAAIMAEEKAAMAQLAWMDGIWRGPAVTQTPGGEHRVTQTERIGPMLGGTIRVLEGKGFSPDGTTGFNAFAILSYDPGTKAFTLHSHAQGRAGDFRLTPTGNGYVWEIPAGAITIRYTATVTNGLWHEVGDRIIPGRDPQRFFEMTLTRIGETSWPAADGPLPQ